MAKICIVCSIQEATYKIKDSLDYYCEECANESFSDLDLLIKVEQDAQKLKIFIKSRLSPQEVEDLNSQEKKYGIEEKSEE